MTVDLRRRDVVAVPRRPGGGRGEHRRPRPGGAATPQFGEALAAFLDGRTPEPGGILLDAPEVAENGNMVAVTIEVESPMTPEDHVRQVVLLATRNPVAQVARFHFTPVSGRAVVGTRIRLAESQDVVVVAETSDGRLRQAKRLVRVTVGGCG